MNEYQWINSLLIKSDTTRMDVLGHSYTILLGTIYGPWAIEGAEFYSSITETRHRLILQVMTVT